MRDKVTILAVVAISVACAASAQTSTGGGEARRIVEAKETVRRTLRDPSSAQFRSVRLYKDGTVCGEVNAKNGYGGYAGFQAFVFSARGEEFSRLRLEYSQLWCSDTRNKPLVQAQEQLYDRIKDCSFAMSESDSVCTSAQEAAANVLRPGGKPIPIPEPHAVSFRKARDSYDLWARLCVEAGDELGTPCLKAQDE